MIEIPFLISFFFLQDSLNVIILRGLPTKIIDVGHNQDNGLSLRCLTSV